MCNLPTAQATRVAAGGLLLLVLAACRGPEAADAPCAGMPAPKLEAPALELAGADVSPRNLRAWVQLLASPRLAGRHAGDPGARETAALLAGQMAAFGLVAPWPEAGYCQGFPLFDGEDYNVVAHHGAAPDDGRPLILLAAHYDGQGIHPAGNFYPGADDNASGVAALLEVARVASRRDQGSGIGWVFALLGGEETGREGTRAYLEAPSVDLSRVELVINLDMVGRPLPGGTGEAIGYLALGAARDATAAAVNEAAARARLEVRPLDDFGDSKPTMTDGEVFAARLSTVLLSTALHEDHHQLTDTPERVVDAQIERAAKLVLALADIIIPRR